jgi:hypothetical protein
MAVATLPFPKMLVKLLEFDGTVTRDNLPVLLEKWAERFFPQEFYPRGTYWQSQHEASFQSKLDEGASDCTKTDSSSLTIDDFLIGFEVICSEEEEEVVIGEDFKVDEFRFQITDVMVLIKCVGFIQDPLAFWQRGSRVPKPWSSAIFATTGTGTTFIARTHDIFNCPKSTTTHQSPSTR